jgi:putative peptide zinc metalloprotease protein
MSKPLSSIHRPLALRLRADLEAVPVEMSGATTWIIKDPLTLEHFQFSAAEYGLMEQLRRPVSIAALQQWFEREHAPQTITPPAVWDFLSRLHEAGLVISDAPGQAGELLARRRRERTRYWATSWARLLAIRFRGIDPDAVLMTIHEQFRWLFSKTALTVALGLMLSALWLVLGHFAEFRARLPELTALVDARNLPWLLLAIGGVKVLHELGHGLACKHFGGEVRELGLMLLVFVPCLYCDVSDAWRLPSKRRRIAVTAAGVVVELVLASIATIVWWYAVPGVAQLVAMNVMIICSVNTLLVNGNPLMRYDGYFILSDLLETPNLWQRSREVLRRMAGNWLLASRVVSGPDPLIPPRHRLGLAVYAVLSKIYLAAVMIAIVWGLVEFLRPYHLQNLAYAAGLIVLGSASIVPVRGAVQLARNPLRRDQLRTGRVALVTAVVLAATVVFLSLPVDYHVNAPVVLLPADAVRVYATIEGTRFESLPAGARVRRGDTIVRLANSETDLEIERLEGEQRLRQLRVEHLERLRGLDREANDELPTARAALADTEHRLAERRRERQRLELKAPVDGVVIPAPRTASSGAANVRLATWSGSLLDTHNQGAHVAPGTLVCLVGEPSRLTAVMLVDDRDVKRLRSGQRAELCIDQLPGQIIEGEVIDVARHDVRDAQSEAAGRADLAPLFAGLVPPGKTTALYQARVRLESPAARSLVIGGRGQAKVAAERITVARRILRFFTQTFRLPM